MSNCLNLSWGHPYMQNVVKGIILVVAIWLDTGSRCRRLMKMDIKQIRKTVGKLAGKQKALIAILFIMILMLFFPTNFYTPFI
jgi:ABC-type xylose transport system permease subunit